MDIALLKSIALLEGHLAPWGKHEELFAKTFEVFLSSAEFKAGSSKAPPSWKTPSDRFRKVISDRKIEVSKALASSGTAEVYGEREQILGDMIYEIKEKNESDREVKENKTAQDKRILEAGEDMRTTALKRQRRRKTSLSPGTVAGNQSEEKIEIMQKDMELRKETENARYLLQKERLSLERKRESRDAEHQIWAKEIETRRVDVDERRTTLEERRFEAEEKERLRKEESSKLELEERRALISVLGGMARKLV